MSYRHQNRNTACEVSPDFMRLLWSWLQDRCDDGARQLVDVYQIHGDSIFTAHNDDSRDNLISVKDANGHTTQFDYDRNNRVIKETRPLGQQISYAYDADGNLTTITQPNGQRTQLSYDDAGRYSSAAEYSSATAATAANTISYTYTTTGQLQSWNNGAQSATLSYDTQGRKTGETVNYGPFQLSYAYSHNANGSKSSYTGPDGVTATYLYDDNNQLSTVQLPGGSVTINEYTWVAPKQITLPGGTVQSYSHTNLLNLQSMEVKSPTQNIIAQLNYSHDVLQNVTQKNSDNSTNSYSYDDNQRLIQAQQSPLGNRNYTLDGAGNRTADDSGTWSYNDNNQLLSSPGVTYSYDSNGNLISKTQGSAVTNYSYDHNNRLTHVEDSNGNTLANYGYDPFGRRLWKEINGIKTYYFYSDEGLVAEYGQTGTQLVSYGYKPDSTWGTNPLYLRNDSGFYFYHNDHLGTPFKLTAVDGSVVWGAVYDAFGKATVDPVSTITSNLRFPGQYFDAETGLHYNWMRYYDPESGRYVTHDPIGLRGGINTYLYVSGSPMSWIDPLGLKYTVNQNGNTITVSTSITTYGPNASESLARQWQQSINNHWNNNGNNFNYGKCKVQFDVKVNADSKSNWWFTANSSDNKVYVVNDPNHRSYVFNGQYGRWSSTDSGWVVAHETGHLFNLPDDYQDDSSGISKPNPGHSGHMMGDYGGSVSQHEIDDIINGQTTCGCK